MADHPSSNVPEMNPEKQVLRGILTHIEENRVALHLIAQKVDSLDPKRAPRDEALGAIAQEREKVKELLAPLRDQIEHL